MMVEWLPQSVAMLGCLSARFYQLLFVNIIFKDEAQTLCLHISIGEELFG